MIRIEAPPQSARRRLLGGWRDIYEDIRVLHRSLADLPDECACGDGAGHLNGTCQCCGGVARHRVPPCGTCDEQLARLRPAIDALGVDISRFFPFVAAVLARHDREAAERARTIAAAAAALTASFNTLLLAAGKFRMNCRVSHVHALKQAGAALLADAASLDRLVK